MSIYVYKTTNGTLYSYIPDNLTIAQAQASGQLASTNTLTSNGMTAVDSLPPLDTTHVWNPTTKTVDTVAAPTPVNLVNTFDFIMAFTADELATVRASTDAHVQQFLYAFQVTQGLDLNATTITAALTYLVNHSLLTGPRAQAIGATLKSNTATGML